LPSFNRRTSYTAPNCGMITGLAIMSLDDYLEGQLSLEEKHPWYREINSFQVIHSEHRLQLIYNNSPTNTHS